jgi:hypothetical protein
MIAAAVIAIATIWPLDSWSCSTRPRNVVEKAEPVNSKMGGLAGRDRGDTFVLVTRFGARQASTSIDVGFRGSEVAVRRCLSPLQKRDASARMVLVDTLFRSRGRSLGSNDRGSLARAPGERDRVTNAQRGRWRARAIRRAPFDLRPRGAGTPEEELAMQQGSFIGALASSLRSSELGSYQGLDL